MHEKRKDYDWNTIRTVYITGTESYRALCKKYNVPESTLMKKGKLEDWYGKRKEYQKELIAKVGEKTAEATAEKLYSLQKAADNLAEEMERRTADMNECSAKDILDYTKAVRELTATLRNLYEIPSLSEREAQSIAAERLKIERKRVSAMDVDKSVKVIFEGGEDLREEFEDEPYN